MNNEPVAWMIKTLDGRSLMLYGEEQPPKFKEDVQYIPLYTHPVKELTDEEIEEIAEEFKDVDYTLDDEEAFDVFNHRGFARAILRKAQEK